MTTMSVGPVPLVDHTAPQLSGATTEILTVSALLSMPAVWTTVVERTLPVDVLLERFMIVLFTCALLAELVRRLGEGGALSRAMAEATPAVEAATEPLPTTASSSAAGLTEYDAPLALDGPLVENPSDLGDFDNPSLDNPGDLGDLELAPLDLDADPFAEPA